MFDMVVWGKKLSLELTFLELWSCHQMVKSAVLTCLTKLQSVLHKPTLPGVYLVFGCGYNLTGVKLKASFVCD